MWRWTFNILAAVSLVMGMMTVVLWTRSYFVADTLEWSDGSMDPVIRLSELGVASARGGIAAWSRYREWRGVFAGWIPTGRRSAWTQKRKDFSSPVYDPYFTPSAKPMISKYGLQLVLANKGDEFEHVYSIAVPYPLLATLLAIPCVLTIRRLLSSRRHPGHCLVCSYNLTGNTSGICPECGMPVKSPVETKP